MSGRREISSLPLKASDQKLLLRGGFRTVADLRDVKPSELARELGIDVTAANEILECVCVKDPGIEDATESLVAHAPAASSSSSSSALGKTAEEIYSESRRRVNIITFCKALDCMLGGGVHGGEIIEFCGVPGIGKTQLAMQLAVDVQIPTAFKGAGGEAIYIDTEGSFMVERALAMSAAVVKHLKGLAKRSGASEQMAGLVAGLDDSSFLKGIFVMRVHDHVEQLAAVNMLPELLKQRPNVKLVVMDSVAFHFRHGASAADFGLRGRQLATMAQKLNEFAHKSAAAVVLVNQMTTKVGGGDLSKLVPALGESWAHAAAHRVQLFWADSSFDPSFGPSGGAGAGAGGGSAGLTVAERYASAERRARLIKSSSRPPGEARYTVTEHGVRDLRGSQAQAHTQPSRTAREEQPSQPQQPAPRLHQREADSESMHPGMPPPAWAPQTPHGSGYPATPAPRSYAGSHYGESSGDGQARGRHSYHPSTSDATLAFAPSPAHGFAALNTPDGSSSNGEHPADPKRHRGER